MKTSGKSWARYIDKSIKAKKVGFRKSSVTGERYYEARPDHSDSNPKERYADGGKTDESFTYELRTITGVENKGKTNQKFRYVWGGDVLQNGKVVALLDFKYFSKEEATDEAKKIIAKLKSSKMAKGGSTMYDYTKTMGLVKVKFSNPKYNYSTSVSGDISETEARKYFVGKMFDVGSYPKENMQKVVDIEFFPKGTYDETYARGGKTKKDPPIVRGYFEDEPYEYGKGGKTKSKQDPPIVRSYFEDEAIDYATGGSVGGVEIDNFRRNIMGTLSFNLKLPSMRKSQDFSVYPVNEKTDYITIQSSTRIGLIQMTTGKGAMSQSHSSGAYFIHLQTDKKVLFQLSESQLEQLKQELSKTAGANVGTRGIVSDNQYADKFADGGLLGGFNYSIGGL